MKRFLISLLAFLWIGAQAQTLENITPSSGGRGDRLSVTITISGMHASNVYYVYMYDSTNTDWINMDSLMAVNDTVLTGKIAIPKYAIDAPLNITMFTRWGQTVTFKNAFEISGGATLPVVKSITPATGARGDQINFTINCSDMGFTAYDPEEDLQLRLMDSTNAYWSDMDSIVIVNDSVLEASLTLSRFLPDGPLDFYVVTSDNNYAYLRNAFTVNGGMSMAKILSITPGVVEAGDGVVSFRMVCSGTAFEKFNNSEISPSLFDSLGYGLTLNSVGIVNDSTLDVSFYVPAYIPETDMHLSIYCPDGNLFQENMVKVHGPKIVSITPSTGGRGQTVPVTITCSHTKFTTSSPTDISAYFRDSLSNYFSVESLTVKNDTVLTGELRINRYTPDEKVDLSINVMTPGILITLKNAFEISGGSPMPAIVSMSPSTGERKENLNVTIKTQGLELTSYQPYQVQLAFYDSLSNYYPFNSVSILNDSILNANVNVPGGLYDGAGLGLMLSTPLDYVLAKNIFTVMGGPMVPHILSATPSSGGRGDKLDVTITCTGTEFTPLDPEYDLHIQYRDNMGNITMIDSLVIVNDSVLQCKLTVSRFHADNASLTLLIQTPDQTFQLQNALVVNGGKPLAGIVSVTPNTAGRGDVINLKINCTGTQFTKLGSRVVYVSLRSPELVYDIAPAFTAVNDTLVKATVGIPTFLSDNAAIDVQLYMENGSSLSLLSALTISGGDNYGYPSIESVSPSTIESNTAVDIIITCKNTVFITSGISSVNIEDAAINNWTVIDKTTLKVNLIAWQTGYKKITIQSMSDGMISLESAVLVIANTHIPRITKVDPAILYKGTKMDVMISTANTRFTQATYVAAGFSSPTNAVTVNRIDVINDTTLKCSVTVRKNMDNETCQLTVLDDIDGFMTYMTEILIVNTGVAEQEPDAERLVVYPNPSSGDVFMDVNFSSNHSYDLKVMNMTGTLVYAGTTTLSHSGKQTISLNKDAMGLKEGFYFVQVKQDNKTYYAKMQIR